MIPWATFEAIACKGISVKRFDTVQALKKFSFNPVSKIFVLHDIRYYAVPNLDEI